MGKGKRERPPNSLAAELQSLKRKHDAALLVITALVRRSGREVISKRELESLDRQPVTLTTRQGEDGGLVLQTRDAPARVPQPATAAATQVPAIALAGG